MSQYITQIIGLIALCGCLTALTVGLWRKMQADHVINQLKEGGIIK